MADKERYIDADALIEKLRSIYVYPPSVSGNYYNSSSDSLDYALQNRLNQAIGQTVSMAIDTFKFELIKAIEATATLKGTPCFLCKQRDGDEIPDNPFGCPGKAAISKQV